MSDPAYTQLLARARTLRILQTTRDLVHWDMETKMPPRGVAQRSEQLALLRQLEHRMTTDPEIGTLLESAERDAAAADPHRRRNLHLLRKAYLEQTSLPEALVTETERQRALTVDVWKKAKAANDFAPFRPALEALVHLKRRTAEILRDVKGTPTAYDALVDIYEPGMTASAIAAVFAGLKRGLVTLIDRCGDAGPLHSAAELPRHVPVAAQRRLAQRLASFLGYDIESPRAGGRIDETEHPFSTGYYDDVRVTTHYHEDRFLSSIFSVLHEGGHALYDQHLPPAWKYQPIGDAGSMGIHESQSRFVENIVGRSRAFWEHFLPVFREETGHHVGDLDAVYAAINRVQPAAIRIEADEVTYSLHVIIRFEIERDLIADRITVAELPTVWNQKYAEYLGVRVPSDAAGVLQDTHWASGSIGYFPSYALGNIYSGQFLARMAQDLPDWRAAVARGRFNNVAQWLREHVHRAGKLYDTAALVQQVTGDAITPTPYLDYLRAKYADIYGF
jgi:carboxypeptidase Taq